MSVFVIESLLLVFYIYRLPFQPICILPGACMCGAWVVMPPLPKNIMSFSLKVGAKQALHATNKPRVRRILQLQLVSG